MKRFTMNDPDLSDICYFLNQLELENRCVPKTGAVSSVHASKTDRLLLTGILRVYNDAICELRCFRFLNDTQHKKMKEILKLLKAIKI